MKPDGATALGVYLHRRRVGILNRLAGDTQVFAFEPEYIDDAGRATLSLSFRSQSRGLLTSIRPVRRRVPPFFSNLLPEGHLREYLAAQAGVHPEREFFLLAALGADLPGAVTVAELDRQGAPLIPDAPERMPEPRASANDGLRFSLAGVQLKFSAIMDASGGLTIPAHGVGGQWIVKLPSMRFAAVSENEYVMLALAAAIGIRVPRTRLAPVSSIGGLPPEAAALPGNALVVERFDRGPHGARIHMEDFAQVFGLFPESKYTSVSYANMARVLLAEAGQADADEFVRRLVFSVLIGNGDMHLKNWSLLYPDARHPVLAPAYDFVSTLAYLAGDALALSFGGTRRIDAISADQLRRFAGTAGLPLTPVLRLARETAEATASAWQTLPDRQLLPPDLRQLIGQHIVNTAGMVGKP